MSVGSSTGVLISGIGLLGLAGLSDEDTADTFVFICGFPARSGGEVPGLVAREELYDGLRDLLLLDPIAVFGV